MKKSISIIILIMVFFTNCAFATKKPDWINNVEKDCFKNEICATGSGTSPNMAKTDARNNILKYFETNINSKFTSSLSTNEIEEKSFKAEDLEEISSGILKGVKIRNAYDDGKDFYAFAVLDKNIATREIESDIKKTDSKMKLLLSENNVRYNKELEKLYIKREELNKRYLILTGNMIPEVVKYEDIFVAKKKSGELSFTYYILPSSGFEYQVASYLKDVILESGAKITDNKKDANRFIQISIDNEKMYLNVSGFEKEMYVLEIEVLNSSSEILASLNNEFVETGRNKRQIKEIVNIKIKEFIDNNIEKILQ